MHIRTSFVTSSKQNNVKRINPCTIFVSLTTKLAQEDSVVFLPFVSIYECVYI